MEEKSPVVKFQQEIETLTKDPVYQLDPERVKLLQKQADDIISRIDQQISENGTLFGH